MKLKNAYQFLPLFRNHKYDRKDYVKWMTAGISIRGIVNCELHDEKVKYSQPYQHISVKFSGRA